MLQIKSWWIMFHVNIYFANFPKFLKTFKSAKIFLIQFFKVLQIEINYFTI